MFGSDCVHENVVIGVTVGVGGAILVALLVIVITLIFIQSKVRTTKHKKADYKNIS